MTCLHRFLDYHREGILPSWNVKYLFIGTFNPAWNKPGNNADYFYGRSTYFWKILPRFVLQDSLRDSSIEQKVTFCQSNFLGFTDLISRIENVDYNNRFHREKILSFKDSDLLTFDSDLIYNTNNILTFIDSSPNIESIFFTLLGENAGSISVAIEQIENHCPRNQSRISTYRLHTHSGQGLGTGTPRENVLTQRWYIQGLSTLNHQFNPNAFPFQ